MKYKKDLRDELQFYKKQAKAAKLDLSELKSLVVKCFARNPVVCDGRLSVSADNYNALAAHLNKL